MYIYIYNSYLNAKIRLKATILTFSVKSMTYIINLYIYQNITYFNPINQIKLKNNIEYVNFLYYRKFTELT